MQDIKRCMMVTLKRCKTIVQLSVLNLLLAVVWIVGSLIFAHFYYN